ncbi:putative transmembrane protein [Apostichopus japonicus]|uniref:Putative transmembrane protein n=1 Tax=Stichopus japonicus TaxID=307972 RepID=A0A2G8L9S9_STIJA|nr:putative transmembrane protein [Apostichopus japonicus]
MFVLASLKTVFSVLYDRKNIKQKFNWMRGDILQTDAQSTLRSLFGSSELPSHVQEAGLRGGTSSAESSSVFSTIAQYLPREIKRLLAVLSQRVKDLPSHQLCKHEGSCVHYISEGFLSRFCLGYAIQTAFNLFRSIPKVMQQPSRVPWSLLDKGNVYLGLFMGGLVGLFRVSFPLPRRSSKNTLAVQKSSHLAFYIIL